MADAIDPDTAEILAVYDLLQNDKAFNKDCVGHASGVRDGIGSLSKLMADLELSDLNPHAQQLGYFQQGVMTDLIVHLNDQFDNLTTNLGLVSGYISDLSELQRLPGFNDASPKTFARSVASGSYMRQSQVSPMALMINFAAETGSGGGTASATGGQCSSMGSAFGSIMGKASQFMGQAMGMLGQVQGMMGNLMGGGVLNMLGKFGNIGGLGAIPGLGSIGSLVGNLGNIGNIGQIGSMISSIGSFGNIGALGSQLTSIMGGAGSALGNLTKLGGIISAMGGFVNQSQSIGGVPLISAQSPYAVQTQLNGVVDTLATYDVTDLVNEILALADKLTALLNIAETAPVPPPLSGGAVAPAQSTAVIGNITVLTGQLYGLSDYLRAPGNISKVGDISPIITDLTVFKTSIDTYVPASAEKTDILARMVKVLAYLVQINNMQALVTQMGSLGTTLGDYGGSTGFGNVASIIGMGQGILSRLGGLGSIPGLSQLPIVGSLLGNMQGMMGSFGSLLNGNISGVIGNLGGLTGQLSGLMGGLGLGKITGMLGMLPGGLGGIAGQLGGLLGGGGGLGGIMGGIGGMIGGEKGMLGQATNSLKIIAGSYNLKSLKGNACAGSVLGNVGSDALKSAQGGSSGGTSSADMGTSTGTGGSSEFELGGKDDVFGGPNASLYDGSSSKIDGNDLSNGSLDTQTSSNSDFSLDGNGSDIIRPVESQSASAFTNTNGSGDGIGGTSTALNQQYIDQVSTTPALRGNDESGFTSAQVNEINKEATRSLSGNDESGFTSDQVNALNNNQAEPYIPSKTPTASQSLDPDFSLDGNGKDIIQPVNTPTQTQVTTPPKQNYDLSLDGNGQDIINPQNNSQQYNPSNGSFETPKTSTSVNEGYNTSGSTASSLDNVNPAKQPTSNATEQRVRSTYYYRGEQSSDPDTNSMITSTGVTVRPATATQVGVAAVDPNLIPYGSQIVVQTPDGPRYYIAADTGGAVKRQTASGGSTPVVDFYSTSQVAGEYTNVKIIPYTDTTPFRNLSMSNKQALFDINRFK